MAVIMLEEDGMNRLAIYTGANNDTTPEAVDCLLYTSFFHWKIDTKSVQ